LVLKAKALEDVVGLGKLATWPWHWSLWSWLCNLRLDCVCVMANPIRGHDGNILTGRPNWCLLVRGVGTIFIV